MATTFLVLSDRLGRGDDDLGALLMRSFLYSLARNEVKPERIVFMNGGVRLTCEGSESIDDLRLLAEAGVQVKSCGTCLDYFRLKDAVVVGEVGTMAGSVETLVGSADVVTIA
jgi:selenium metabolism protein YedF